MWCFPKICDARCRVRVANGMITKPQAATLAQTGEQMSLNSVQGSATASDKFISSNLKEQHETGNVVPPVVIPNPYKKIQMNRPNITLFCKPIYTPRSTLRNPHAKDSKVEGHTQLVS